MLVLEFAIRLPFTTYDGYPGFRRLPSRRVMLSDTGMARHSWESLMLPSPFHTGLAHPHHSYFSELYRLRVFIPTQWPTSLLSTLHLLCCLTGARLATEPPFGLTPMGLPCLPVMGHPLVTASFAWRTFKKDTTYFLISTPFLKGFSDS